MISKLMIAELFYSRISNINRGSLHKIYFVYTSPLSDTDELKMALRAENFPGLSRNGSQVTKHLYTSYA